MQADDGRGAHPAQVVRQFDVQEAEQGMGEDVAVPVDPGVPQECGDMLVEHLRRRGQVVALEGKLTGQSGARVGVVRCALDQCVTDCRQPGEGGGARSQP